MHNKGALRAAVVGATLLLSTAAQATVFHFGFGGDFRLRDDDGDFVRETLEFGDAPLAGGFTVGAGLPVSVITPAPDAGFSGGEYVTIATMTLGVNAGNIGSFSSSDPVPFSPTTYVNGFRLFDAGDQLLLSGDIEVDELVHIANTGLLNPTFSVNLTNIVLTPTAVALNSTILNGFLNGDGSAAGYTLQFGAQTLFSAIANVGQSTAPIIDTISGSAVEAPEPFAIGLFGLGILGAGLLRRKSA